MAAVHEVLRPRQVPGEPPRRWFSSSDLDLIVWCDAAGAPVAFQLCYDKGRDERALTWEPSTGLIYSAVDDGEASPGMRYKATPVLEPDAAVDLGRLAARFVADSDGVPADIVDFVSARLLE